MWWKLTIIAVAVAVVVTVGLQVLQAQTPPRAYLIAEIQVTDPETYKA